MSMGDAGWPPDFDPPLARKTYTVKATPPLDCGFSLLTVKGTYMIREHLLSLSVFASNKSPNKGPGLGYREQKKIPRGKHVDIVHEVKAFADKVKGLLRKREIPERGLHLDTCNPTGQDVGTFIERVCSGCVCWYCELSS